MNEIEIFKNADFGEVRTVTIENEPWFVGKDVADILGYSNTQKAISNHVDEEDKGVTKWDTLGGVQNMTIINESGLYSLILSSKMPAAKKFKHWVTSEVLPAIRKRGAYMTDSAFESLSPQLQLLINLETKQKEQEKALADIQKRLDEQEYNRDEIIKATLAFGRISYSQQKEISKAVRVKAMELCRYAQTFDAVGNRIISSIYKGIQKYFDVKSYKDLCFNQLTESFAFIADYVPESKLQLAINQAMPKTDMSIFEFFGK